MLWLALVIGISCKKAEERIDRTSDISMKSRVGSRFGGHSHRPMVDQRLTAKEVNKGFAFQADGLHRGLNSTKAPPKNVSGRSTKDVCSDPDWFTDLGITEWQQGAYGEQYAFRDGWYCAIEAAGVYVLCKSGADEGKFWRQEDENAGPCGDEYSSRTDLGIYSWEFTPGQLECVDRQLFTDTQCVVWYESESGRTEYCQDPSSGEIKYSYQYEGEGNIYRESLADGHWVSDNTKELKRGLCVGDYSCQALPSWVGSFAEGDWSAGLDGAQVALKEGWVCSRTRSMNGYNYYCSKDGVDVSYREGEQRCNGPAAAPNVPEVLIPAVPTPAASCIGRPTLTRETCAVTYYSGPAANPTEVEAMCKNANAWFQYKYAGATEVGLWYGDGDSRTVKYKDGACSKFETCSGALPGLLADIEWKPYNYQSVSWFEDFGVKDGWFCTRYCFGDVGYTCVNNGVELEFEGSSTTGQCFGATAWPSLSTPVTFALSDDAAKCLDILVETPVCVYSSWWEDPSHYSYGARSVLNDYIVSGIEVGSDGEGQYSARADLDLLGWGQAGSLYYSTPECGGQVDEAKPEDVSAFNWAGGITDWGGFGMVEVGVNSGKFCQKYEEAWRCFKNAQTCYGLLPTDAFNVTYDSCGSDGWTGATIEVLSPTQEQKLDAYLDTSKCAVLYKSDANTMSYCWIAGKVTSISAHDDGSADVYVFGANGTQIGRINLDVSGEVQADGVMPNEEDGPQDGQSSSEKPKGLHPGAIAGIVIGVVVVVAAVAVGIYCCVKKSAAPQEETP
jgi:hypothetical protein